MKMLVNLLSRDNKKEEHDENEEVGKGTKLKVVAALLIVGFAVYVAWWVQEPVGVKADLLENRTLTGEVEEGEALSLLAQAETPSLTQEVSIEAFTFVPAEITVEKGTTVTWVNRDTVPHTVTGDTFSSGTLDLGQAYSRTFKNDGTYEYSCSFYPQMKGTIVVGTGVGAGEGAGVGNLDAEIDLDQFEFTDEAEDLFTTQAETQIPTFDDLLIDMDAGTAELREAAPVTFEDDSASFRIAAEDLGEETHGAAEESDRIADSGPEHLLYLGAFFVIMYLQRRRLFRA